MSEKPQPPTPLPPEWVRLVHDGLKRVAQATTNLTLGLDAAEKAAQARHQELVGLSLAAIPQKRGKTQKAKTQKAAMGGAEMSIESDGPTRGEDSVKFPLPGGGFLEIPRHQWFKLLWMGLKWGTVIVFGVGGWLAHFHNGGWDKLMHLLRGG